MHVGLATKFAALWESSDSPPDVFAFLQQHSDAPSSEKLNVLLCDQAKRWRTDRPLRVEDYLAQMPEIATDRDLKLQLAVGEFVARQNAGIPVTIEEFASTHSGLDGLLTSKLLELTTSQHGGIPTDDFAAKSSYISERTIGDERVGRYRLVQILGEGGFGRVWLGFDEELRRQVAIKVPTPERFQKPEDAEEYLAEARTVASLDHPHIVPVYDVGRTQDGSIYVVSKFIEGSNLADRIKQDRPSFAAAANLLAPVAHALHHAHLRRLIHRDIKPANILIEDRTNTTYVADFGLAISEEDYLRKGKLAGTIPYMSPEQARGEGHRLDGRSDIFALGVVLYELLTGQRPFQGNSSIEILLKITEDDPVPPRELNGTIPPELERICLKALSKRASDRYATATELADDLAHWQRGPQPPQVELQIVPKGLRSFDADDADFFLQLLPGPRNRDGLPESIQFWKTRIEETDPDHTFSVGLIYGPSGCGKSSLVKAGLLPRLSNDIIALYIEATSDETETRILRGLRKNFSDLSHDLGLVETLASLRRREGKKVVLVLDQFEQWLHAHRTEQNTELVSALRHCDGGHVQAVVMVRDDFAMAAARFMDSLDIPILQGHNFATVDLFDTDHAKKVLTKFGQAFGKLPHQLSQLSADENAFVSSVATGLAHDGKVVSVRLALFAEMVKGKSWNPATLQKVGGTQGIGVNFLEEAFSSRSANPKHRLHQQAARAVLKSLLPEVGTDIKGLMRSHGELLGASGYASRPQDFQELLRVLDGELRLITPTDPQELSSDSGSDPNSKYYQLTHDYLVPSLRDWLSRKQKETRRGRAELLLADRAAVWNARPENRQLPSLWQWCSIQCLTPKKNWTPPQQKMMAKAGRVLGIRSGLVVSLLALVIAVGFAINRQTQEQQDKNHALALVQSLVAVDTPDVEKSLDEVGKYQRWAIPRLQEIVSDSASSPKEKLHASLALLPVDSRQVEFLYGQLLAAEPQEITVIREALLDHKHDLIERSWKVLEDAKHDQGQRLRAACALAAFSPDDSRWEKAAGDVAATLVIQKPFEIAHWTDALKGAGKYLISPLAGFLVNEQRGVSERGLIATVYGTYAAEVPDAYALLEKQLAEQIEPQASEAQEVQEEQTTALAKRQASIGMALLVMGRAEKVWPLLKHRPDPTMRSFLIERLGPGGVNPKVLTARLAEETEVSIRRAILLSLGQFGLDRLSPIERANIVPQLSKLYRDEPDPGIHGAAQWLLRQWQATDELTEINKSLATGNVEGQRQWYVNRQGQTMIVSKPAEFWMGEGLGRHRMRIGRSFAIASQEVTVEQFRRFRQDHDYSKEYSPTGDCPMNCVSWYDAAEYCNWLSEQEGLSKDEWCYVPNQAGKYAEGMKMAPKYLQLVGYRLPTEAEWEFTCRAGAEAEFCFGRPVELLSNYAWYSHNSVYSSHSVGSLKPNDLGLYDMHGNNFEWCQNAIKANIHGENGKATEDSDDGGDVGHKYYCASRSGCFANQPWDSHSAVCFPMEGKGGHDTMGFRLARTLPPISLTSLSPPAVGRANLKSP